MGLLDKFEEYRSFAPGQAGLPAFGNSFYGYDNPLFKDSEPQGELLATSNEIFACATLRARLMSSINLKCYKGAGTRKKLVEDSPSVNLLDYVNPFWTKKRLARMDELAMCIWGENFWAVEWENGKPKEIWWLKASQVRPELDSQNYISKFIYQPISGGDAIEFSPKEIIWFRYPNPLDEFSPLSPVAAARLAAENASAMMKSNRGLFVNGLQMGGIISPTDKMTFSEDQANDLQLGIERRFKGVDKAHKWLILRYEAEIKGMNVTPKDAEFLGGLRMTLKQVANAYGIPVPLLNEMEGATLSNSREYQSILWTNALKPDAELKASEIEEQYLPLFRDRVDHCGYDFSEIEALQEAKSDAWTRERQAIEVGRYTINEIRERNGEPPVAWGDVWWGPVNKFAIDGVDSEPPKAAVTPSADANDPETLKGETSDPVKPEVSEDDTRALFKSLVLNGREVVT